MADGVAARRCWHLADEQTIRSGIDRTALGMLLLGGIGGIVAAIYHTRWPDRLLSSFALSGLSTPEFIVATLLILVFDVGLRWLPAVSLPPPSGHISEQ